MNLPRFAVRNPVAVNLLMWVIIVGGAVCWGSLVRELFPNTEAEGLQVQVLDKAASPEEIQDLVTEPVETALQGLDGVERVRSRVLEGLSLTSLQLFDDADRDRVLNEVRTRMDRVRPDLPQDVEEPTIVELRPLLPVISVVVYGEVRESLLRRAARDVADDLRGLPGVSRVGVSGIRDREIEAAVPLAQLEAYGLSLQGIGRRVAAGNLDLAGGQLEGDRSNVRVRTEGKRKRAAALEGASLRPRAGGGRLVLSEVARVRDGFEDRAEGGWFSGLPAILVTCLKTPEEDAVDIADKVKAYVAAHATQLGGAVQLAVMNDLSRFISQRLDLMLRNARTGLLFVLLALALFLDLRVAFWVAVGIPISFLGTFLLMRLLGASINLISLFGLIIVLGMLVDDAIVIGENVFRKLREGVPPARAAIEGAGEVALPVVAAILTTVAAFLPLRYIDGRMGNFLGVLPVVVIAALSISMIEAFLILPSHLGHVDPRGLWHRVPWLQRLAERLHAVRSLVLERVLPDLTERVVRWALRWRYVTLAVAVAIAIVGAGLVAGGVVPFVFLQDVDAEILVCDLEMAPGTPAARTRDALAEIERRVLAYPETRTVFSVVGTAFGTEGRISPEDPATRGQITLELVAADEREARGMRTSQTILRELREATRGLTGVERLSFVARSGGPGGPDIEVQVRGREVSSIRRAVAIIERKLARFAGVSEVRNDLSPGKREVRLQLRARAADLGLTTRDVAIQVRHAVLGFEAQELQDGEDRVTIRVRLPAAERRSVRDLQALRIQTPTGARVPLSEVCVLRLAAGTASISRVDGQRTATVIADVDQERANTGAITEALSQQVPSIERQVPGVRITFEGKKKETQESMGSLAYGFPVALLLIYALVAIVFRSYTQPVIVMVAVPFGIVGAILGHLAMGYPITMLSVIGIVALSGIAVNDSLVLVDFINRFRREGHSLDEAVIAGPRERLRAILLTSVTTIAGLAPLMLERSFQAQFLIPMAVSLVFGLLATTVVTLVLVPVLYRIWADLAGALRWLRTGSA